MIQSSTAAVCASTLLPSASTTAHAPFSSGSASIHDGLVSSPSSKSSENSSPVCGGVAAALAGEPAGPDALAPETPADPPEPDRPIAAGEAAGALAPPIPLAPPDSFCGEPVRALGSA